MPDRTYMPHSSHTASHHAENKRHGLFISLLVVTLFSGLLSSLSVSAREMMTEPQQPLLTLDGREIELNADGTWQYLSTDRFIDTPDGRRIRLKQNGTWEYIGNAPMSDKREQRTAAMSVLLDKVVIERTEKKVQKNTRVRTRTVFTVNVSLAAESANDLLLESLDPGTVSVQDNKSKPYTILEIRHQHARIKPGKSGQLEVIVDKSPFIFDAVKSLTVTFDNSFGRGNNFSLSQDMDNIDEIKVERFD